MAKPKLHVVEDDSPKQNPGWIKTTDHLKKPGDIVLGNSTKPATIIQDIERP
mgnify:CR=1 FL=1